MSVDARTSANGPASVPPAGRTVGGRYTLRSSVGSGGMGTVWRAYDELLRREIAVKEVLLPPGLPPAERDLLCERTLREARAAAALSHPSVIRVYDVVTDEDRPWIVMELLEARSLADVLREDGPLPSGKVAEAGLAVLGALEAAHRVGVLHRDVKPGNVLLGTDGRVTLTDFGVARSPGESPLTSTGLLLGSPQYIAPERARGRPFGPASDLFSLGATLYTAVEGRPPFDRGDPLPTMTAVVCEPPDTMRFAGPIAPVLIGLMEKDPAQRWDTTRTRAALRTVLAGGRVTALGGGPTPPRQARTAVTPARRRGGIDEPTGAQPPPMPPVPPRRPGPPPPPPLEGTAAMAVPFPTDTGISPLPADAPSTGRHGSDAPRPVSPAGAGGRLRPGDPGAGPVSGAGPMSGVPPLGGARPVSGAGGTRPVSGVGSVRPPAGGRPLDRSPSGPPPLGASGPPGGPFGPAGPAPTRVGPSWHGAHGTAAMQASPYAMQDAATAPIPPPAAPRRAAYLDGAGPVGPGGPPYGAPHPGGEPGHHAVPSGRRGLVRLALAALAVVLVAGLGTYLVSALFSGDPAGTAPATPTASAPAAAGLTPYTGDGYAVSVPTGWQKNQPTKGVWVDFVEPETSRKVRLLVESTRADDPEDFVAAAEGQQRKYLQSGTISSYTRVAFRASPRKLAGRDTWEWEWTDTKAGDRRRVFWRSTIADGKAYSVYILTADDGNFADDRALLDQLTASYRLDS